MRPAPIATPSSAGPSRVPARSTVVAGAQVVAGVAHVAPGRDGLVQDDRVAVDLDELDLA